MKVLVFIEQRNGRLKASSFEALGVGLKLAKNSADLSAVVIGQGAAGIAAQLKDMGADTVYICEGDAYSNYNVISYRDALEAAVKKSQAQLILGMATPLGRDLMPRLCARMNGGMLTDLVEINENGGFVQGLKPMFSGKCFAQVALQNCSHQFVTLRPNVFPKVAKGSGAARAESLSVTSQPIAGFTTREIRKGKSEKPDLTEASVIVSGGRSMGNADNFKILHELADVIHATVGASRAAVDAGYASHDMQVGQTGKTVNPNLYIACGISGAIQHMAGMRTSKVIVAINTDPEAPITTIANYTIVADLFKTVPIMTQKFKELLKDA